MTVDAYLAFERPWPQKAHVEHYARQEDGSWPLREAGPGGAIELGSVQLRLDVDALYAGAFELPS